MAANNDIGFIHTVFFWLKEDVSAEQRQEFEKELEALGKTPTIHKYYYGQPEPNDRDVVDASYDYAWICHFKNSEDQAIYQDHPVHHVFIKNCSHLWATVKVYDTVLK